MPPKKIKSVVKKPLNGDVPSYARNAEYKSVNERKKINSKEIFEMDSKKAPSKKKKTVKKRKPAPKGFHYMANGKLMKDSDMPNKASKSGY